MTIWGYSNEHTAKTLSDTKRAEYNKNVSQVKVKQPKKQGEKKWVLNTTEDKKSGNIYIMSNPDITIIMHDCVLSSWFEVYCRTICYWS